jgi:hypothetical protein
VLVNHDGQSLRDRMRRTCSRPTPLSRSEWAHRPWLPWERGTSWVKSEWSATPSSVWLLWTGPEGTGRQQLRVTLRGLPPLGNLGSVSPRQQVGSMRPAVLKSNSPYIVTFTLRFQLCKLSRFLVLHPHSLQRWQGLPADNSISSRAQSSPAQVCVVDSCTASFIDSPPCALAGADMRASLGHTQMRLPFSCEYPGGTRHLTVHWPQF